MKKIEIINAFISDKNGEYFIIFKYNKFDKYIIITSDGNFFHYEFDDQPSNFIFSEDEIIIIMNLLKQKGLIITDSEDYINLINSSAYGKDIRERLDVRENSTIWQQVKYGNFTIVDNELVQIMGKRSDNGELSQISVLDPDNIGGLKTYDLHNNIDSFSLIDYSHKIRFLEILSDLIRENS